MLTFTPPDFSVHTAPWPSWAIAEEAITLIEFLDQLREVLMQSYGDDMKTILQQASTGGTRNVKVNDQPF